ncbi:MAG: hypothetical protein HYR66_07335 [Sphingobacteriales bacterium]|nr:hypothetical protein [Sphingobacteriales bacterium]MBI3718560.1 hypothetical protein [Sphingobacteriales bacterium]
MALPPNFEELKKQLDLEEKQLVKEICSVGYKISSVWDLVNTREEYPEAIPVLIKHLQRPYHSRIKEGIVRALGVGQAKGRANSILLDEYDKALKLGDWSLGWAIGNAFFTLIQKEDVEKIIGIVTNKANGRSREMFVMALGRIKKEESK